MRRILRRGSQRGAIAVEGLIVIPILIAILFGMIELTLLFRNYVAAETLSRTGARIASAEPRFGTTGANNGHDGLPAPDASSFARDAALAIESAGSTLPQETIEEIWVYEANANGRPLNSDSFADPLADCVTAGRCIRYGWFDDDGDGPNPGRIQYRGGSWDPRTINACLLDNPAGRTEVGVYVLARHSWISNFFGTGSPAVTARTAMRFEPITTQRDDEPSTDTTTPGYFAGCK